MSGDSALARDFHPARTLGAISSSRCQISRDEEKPISLRRRETSNFLDELKPAGGARRDRTDDLLLAKQALSQLSYGPVRSE